MIRYFDASALAKRYGKEAGSQAVCRLLDAGNAAVSRLSEVEVASALVRRAREGVISAKERDRALSAVRGDFETLYVIELSAEITAVAIGLLGRYPLRASDSIQLATCLHLQQRLGPTIEMVAYDVRLTEAGRQEGLAVVGH